MFKQLFCAAVACSVASLGLVCESATAETLLKPAVTSQVWTGFDQSVSPEWSIYSTVIPPGNVASQSSEEESDDSDGPIQLVLTTPGIIDNPANYGLTITNSSESYDSVTWSDGSVQLIRSPSAPSPKSLPMKRPAPSLYLPEAVELATVYWYTEAWSKAVIRRQDEKFVARTRFGYSKEIADGSQVLTASGKLLNLTSTYVSLEENTSDDQFSISGSLAVSDLVRKQQRRVSTTAGSGKALHLATYDVRRTVSFDLSGSLAAYRDTSLLIEISDSFTGQTIFKIHQPSSGREKDFSLTGTLDPGYYTITTKATTRLKRDRGNTIARGGAGQFEVNFQIDNSISTEQLLENARTGVMPLDDLMQTFDLDGDDMTYLVAQGDLAAGYLNQYFNKSDLELITDAISQSQDPWADWDQYGSSTVIFDAPVLRRALDVLPDFVVFNADNELVYDSALAKTLDLPAFIDVWYSFGADDTVEDDVSLSPYEVGIYWDTFGRYIDFQIAWGEGYSVSLLEPELAPTTMILIPEPTTGLLILAAGVMLWRRRR